MASGHGRTGRINLQLRYLDDVLQCIASNAGYTPDGWDAGEVAHFLLVAQCADAAIAESDLFTLRLLRLRARAENNAASVMLSARRVLTINFEPTTTPMTAVFDVLTVETEER
jgi:hypothetical protein